MEITKPILIEPGVKYFLNTTLKHCHDFKTKYNNMLLNVGIFLGFIFILGVLLLYKYKGKLTEDELKEKDKMKEQYILNKIKIFKEAKLKTSQDLITGLPNWEIN